MAGRLAVVPLESLDAVAGKGLGKGLAAYFNPAGFFDDVVVFSPLEPSACEIDGMRVVPVRDVGLPGQLKAARVDVVRAYGGSWPAAMVCLHRRWDVPAVVSLHDRRPVTAHPALRFADVVLGVSQETCALARAKGVPPDRVWLRPNGVDTAGMHPARPLAPPEQGGTILHVGRLSPEKGLDVLLKALALLDNGVRLIVAGAGDPAPYAAAARRAGVAERVRFMGMVPHEQLAELYNAADVVCQPSRDEAMSNVVLEALACGAPAVLSAAAAAGVGAVDGREALVLTEKGPGALASALRRSLEDARLRAALAAGGRALAERFEAGAMARREAGQYERILRMKAEGVFSRGIPFRASVAAARIWYRTAAWVKRVR